MDFPSDIFSVPQDKKRLRNTAINCPRPCKPTRGRSYEFIGNFIWKLKPHNEGAVWVISFKIIDTAFCDFY